MILIIEIFLKRLYFINQKWRLNQIGWPYQVQF